VENAFSGSTTVSIEGANIDSVKRTASGNETTVQFHIVGSGIPWRLQVSSQLKSPTKDLPPTNLRKFYTASVHFDHEISESTPTPNCDPVGYREQP